MTMVDPKEVAGLSSASTQGQGAAASVSAGERIKGAVRWRNAGDLEMEKKAVRVNLKTLFNGEVTAYIPANKIHALVEHRAPAELIRIRVGVDGTEVLEPVGTAYRSKSGRALMIKSAWFAGGEVMAPWAKFCALLEGTVKKARLALPEDVYRPAPAARESTITDGLERGF